jgi:hypothetical protein
MQRIPGGTKTTDEQMKDTSKENWTEPKQARERQSEEGWCRPNAEKGGLRERARNNDPTAQMDIEPGVNMPLTVHSWKRGMTRRVHGKI